MSERFRIICPSCRTVLEGDSKEGLESMRIRCPKCGKTYGFTEFLPFYDDETDLSVARQIQHNCSQPGSGDETQVGLSVNYTIGCIIAPGAPAPIPLRPGRNSIGRKASSSSASIQIEDSSCTMSREHYYIDVIVTGSKVTHLLSVSPKAMNTTELDGVKLEKTDRLVLNDGCHIRSGNVTVEFILK